MKELKYVNFYNSVLANGCTNGTPIEAKNIAIEWNTDNDKQHNMGFYLTPMFDTKTDGGTYNRLVVDGGRIPEDGDMPLDLDGVKLEIVIWTTDSKDIEPITVGKETFTGKTLSEFDSWVRTIKDDDELKAGEKLRDMFRLSSNKANFQRRYYPGAHDILLHDLRGRYVWVLVIFTSHSSPPPRYILNGLRLEFPKHSFIDYFPEIYQTYNNGQDDFFTRYIAIFQSMFLDEERNVDDIPMRLDYNLAPDSDVKNLAEWLGIDNSHGLFSVDNLRKMIRESELFQGKKGTREALKAILELLLPSPSLLDKDSNIKPVVKECFQCKKDGHTCSESIDGGFCIEGYPTLEIKQKQVLKDYFPLGAKLQRNKVASGELKERLLGQTVLEPDNN